MTLPNTPQGVPNSHFRVVAWYAARYDILDSWVLQLGKKVVLGDRANRVCRFCKRTKPEVTFRKIAHAIPESTGNKSIESLYECDPCNGLFGRTFENDFGAWSKPIRTMTGIRGKDGIPTIKGPGFRIEWGLDGMQIQMQEGCDFVKVDKAAKTLTFQLPRDPYTPVAVLKTFVKIGLTLMPEEEVANFRHAMAWVRDTDHGNRFADQCPVIYSFQPGPMPPDRIAAYILRRKPGVTGCAYFYLVLSFGNETYQVQIPSKEHDRNGATAVFPFPPPASPNPARFGSGRTTLRDLTGRERVTGDMTPFVMGFESGQEVPVPGTDAT